MKSSSILKLWLCCIVLTAGCNEIETTQTAPDEQLINSGLINTYNNIAIQNAIVSQHTLYTYHFVKNSEELNELGLRDFKVLAANFIENPGNLNISSANISEELYQRRVEYILDMLQQEGVDADRINIEDGMPGGSGMITESVLVILEKSAETPSPQETSSSIRSTSARIRTTSPGIR